MRSKVERHSEEAEKAVREIRRATRRQYSAEEKVRIVIAGLRGEDTPPPRSWRSSGWSSSRRHRCGAPWPSSPSHGPPSIAGTIAIEATTRKASRIAPRRRGGCGTNSPLRLRKRCSISRSGSRRYRRGSWRSRSSISGATCLGSLGLPAVEGRSDHQSRLHPDEGGRHLRPSQPAHPISSGKPTLLTCV